MPTTSTAAAAALEPPARTHHDAAALFRRPFAPGAIGFRAMTKVPYQGRPYAGAQVAAYLNAQSVLHRLNTVVPGRWRHQFAPLPAELAPTDGGSRKHYLACRLIVTLPLRDGGPDVEAVYEDIGELDAGSFASLKALYSDARKRAAVAARIGAYLYTALAPVVLAIGPGARQVQAIRRSGKSDLLMLSAVTEQWLRSGYRARMSSPAALRDLGPILAHGEADDGMGQGESTDQAAHATEPTATDSAPPAETAATQETAAADERGNGSGELVTVDFGALGPDVPPAA
jgi:Rad52/22 family double-strand break repair protein